MATEGLVDRSGNPLSNGHEAEGAKEVVEPSVLSSSVISHPTATGNGTLPPSLETSILWQVARSADEISPWGKRPKERDRELREFFPTESQFVSALGIVIARNIGFNWVIEGPDAVAKRMKDVLENANSGEGWDDFVGQISLDLYTQDNGAFIEYVREPDRPDGVLIGINSLDAGRCWHTGDPLKPVVYQDRKGQYHLLNWWNVATLAEMPTSIERLRGLQICALSRLLLAAQITKNIAIYKKEKTGGRHNRAIHLVQGMTTAQINDALGQLQANADNQGLLRYINPLIVGTIDPKADIDIKSLELASLPDNFSEADMFKHYIAWIAMAFLTDYQEFAPLPGGNLGTSSQSEILHQKTRGKGPALWMKISSRALNMRGLPSVVTFKYQEQDLEAEMEKAELDRSRSEGLTLLVNSNILSQEEARQKAMEWGILSVDAFQNNSPPERVMKEGNSPETDEKQGTLPSREGGQGQKEDGPSALPFRQWRPTWE